MGKQWMVLAAGLAVAFAASAAPRQAPQPVRVDGAMVVDAAAKKKVVRRKTTTRRTHHETHSTSSSAGKDAKQ